jgi:hypothetical protein
MASLVVIALVAAACVSATSSAIPSITATPSDAPTPPSSAAASATSATTPSPAPTATPAATPGASTACVALPQTIALPSDRVTNLKVSSNATADRLTFIFGNPSLPGPPAPPEGTLEVAKPPYTQGPSGAAIKVVGKHVLQLRFNGMSLSNDAGQETYTGPVEVKPALPGLRHAVIYDESEGIIGWYVGYDGGGCATLDRDGNDVTVTIAHP